jgi:NAD(P)-dependent dehydrogenase (short-subunit alcohol dehydrogenase family)
MHILITGTNRGIGFALTELYLQQGDHVIAVARNADQSETLLTLQKKYKTLTLVSTDVTHPEAGEKIAEAVGTTPIDLLINNAGIFAKGTATEDFINSFHINAVVPFQLTQKLLPQLEKSKNPKVAHITSLMGSIEDNSSGGHYAYRASKSALNMINKCLSVDNQWLTCLVLHPGWVQTDMGGSSAPTHVAESAKGLINVIRNSSIKDTGQFFDFKGEPLPW